MAHDIDGLPPFEHAGEELTDDPEFVQECVEAIRAMSEVDQDIRITESRVSKNSDFGLVYRADFKTSNDGEDSVNRIMFWRLPDGELVSFIGLDIPASPLK